MGRHPGRVPRHPPGRRGPGERAARDRRPPRFRPAAHAGRRPAVHGDLRRAARAGRGAGDGARPGAGRRAPLPSPRRADPIRDVPRRRRPDEHRPVHEPAGRADARVPPRGLDRRPGAVDPAAAPRGPRGRARRARADQRHRDAVRHGVPDGGQGRPDGLGARPGPHRGGRGRVGPLLAGGGHRRDRPEGGGAGPPLDQRAPERRHRGLDRRHLRQEHGRAVHPHQPGRGRSPRPPRRGDRGPDRRRGLRARRGRGGHGRRPRRPGLGPAVELGDHHVDRSRGPHVPHRPKPLPGRGRPDHRRDRGGQRHHRAEPGRRLPPPAERVPDRSAGDRPRGAPPAGRDRDARDDPHPRGRPGGDHQRVRLPPGRGRPPPGGEGRHRGVHRLDGLPDADGRGDGRQDRELRPADDHRGLRRVAGPFGHLPEGDLPRRGRRASPLRRRGGGGAGPQPRGARADVQRPGRGPSHPVRRHRLGGTRQHAPPRRGGAGARPPKGGREGAQAPG